MEIKTTSNSEKNINTNNMTIIDILEKELYEKNLIKDKIDRDILNKVDVIGFDLDHTLAIYKIEAFTELIYNAFARYLVEHKNYPKEILIYSTNESDSNCDLDEREKNKKFNTDFVHKFSGIEVVIDLKNGNAIKIDENRIVIKAYHGIDELSQEQIEKIYGVEKEFTEIHHDNAKGNNCHSILNNFEYHLIPIFLMCVHLLEIGSLKLNSKGAEPFNQIFEDIMEAAVFNYNLIDAEEKRIKNMAESNGYFFNNFQKDPKKYLDDYNPKEMLIHLRNKGVQIFFATNSFYEFADVILRKTIGDDYLDYFDLAVFYSQKPAFFYKDNRNSAYFPDLTKNDHRGQEVTSENVKDDQIFDSLCREKSLIEGSYHVVEEFFRKKKGKEDIKFIYVGDNLYSDVYHSSNLPNWSSIGVLDELNTGFLGNSPQDFKKIWKLEQKALGIEAQERKISSFYTKISREKTLFAVSNVETLKYLN
jgi:5'-nucleotidase